MRGPASLSVADATANESSDSGLNFVVSLDRVSTLTVTVDYATSDGTATAGQDYTATSGTLTFAPGDAAKAINVAVLDDAIDDGGETMTLTLSNASNARIADGTATGTIENSDPLQQAWIARFGRTVASDVVDGITERLKSPRSNSELRIAGHTVESGEAAMSQPANNWSEKRGAAPVQETGLRDAVLGTSFALQRGRGANGNGAWGAWGRFSASSFDGQGDGLTLSGDVVTGLLGADIGTERWTAGLALSTATGDGPFKLIDDNAGSANGPCAEGTVKSTLTSLHPYAQASLSDTVDVWAIGGYGTGEMTIDQTACQALETNIDMMMGAMGLRGQLLNQDAGDAFDSTLRTDALWLRASSKRTTGLAAAEADVQRLRLLVNAGRSFPAGTGTLTPSVEAGLRHDSGDAEEGFGVELGAGLAFQGNGIQIEGNIRTLANHADEHYDEWGASFAVRVDPGNDGRGLSLSITPAWGNAASNTERLWGTRTADELAGAEPFDAGRQIDAELGYAVQGPAGVGTLTPYGGFSLANDAGRTLRTGLRWNASDTATLSLEGTHVTDRDGNAPTTSMLLRTEVRW